MPIPNEINGLTIIALGVLLGAIVWHDIRTHRIENVSIMAIVMLGLLSQLLEKGVPGIVQWLSGMAVGLGLLLPFYIGGGMAAGDVKLLAAVGSVLGPVSTLLAGGITLMAGAALGLLAFYRHKTPVDSVSQGHSPDLDQTDGTLVRRKHRLPYAAAIAAGTVGGLVYSGRLQNFLGVII